MICTLSSELKTSVPTVSVISEVYLTALGSGPLSFNFSIFTVTSPPGFFQYVRDESTNQEEEDHWEPVPRKALRQQVSRQFPKLPWLNADSKEPPQLPQPRPPPPHSHHHQTNNTPLTPSPPAYTTTNTIPHHHHYHHHDHYNHHTTTTTTITITTPPPSPLPPPHPISCSHLCPTWKRNESGPTSASRVPHETELGCPY